MLCSTIIPTIGRDTLSRAVESALSQDLDPTEHEIIVVNDSGAPLAASAWMNSTQIRVMDTNRSRVCFASNAGAAAARGKYLKFLHDDDYLLDGALRSLISEAESSGSCWIVGAMRVVDSQGKLLHVETSQDEGNLAALFVVGEIFHVSRSLIRRQDFLKVGGFDASVGMFEDRELEWRMAMVGEFGSTETMVACARVSCTQDSAYDAQKDGTRIQMIRDSRRIRERILNAEGANRRIRDSLHGKHHLRGRVCRAYMLSAALRCCDAAVLVALSRVVAALRLAAPGLVHRAFWAGLFGRRHFE